MAGEKWKIIGISHQYSITLPQGGQGTVMALDRVSFSQSYGEIIGVIGGKGAGKSTLGAILTEEIKPSEGLVSGSADKSGRLSLPSHRNEDRTGEHYIKQRLTKWGVSKKKTPELLNQILDFSELSEMSTQKLRHYTQEEKVQLEISILLHVAPTLIYIEESLLSVKEHFYIKVFLFLEKLKELGSSIWIETEHIKRIEDYCDKLVWLEFGQLQGHGDPLDVLPDYFDYYFQLQRQSLSEQQAFWREGYRGQTSQPNLHETPVEVEPEPLGLLTPADEGQGERDGQEALDPQQEALTESPLSRKETYQQSLKKRGAMTKVVFFLLLLLVVAGLTLNQLAAQGPKLPKTAANLGSTTSQTDFSASSSSHTVSSQAQALLPETAGLAETHRVRAGESLSQIADLYQLSESQLRQWNGLLSDQIQPDLVLSLVEVKQGLAPEVEVASFNYQVKQGDTLATIAEAYGVSLGALQAANQLETAMIYAGTVLALPISAKEPNQESQAGASELADGGQGDNHAPESNLDSGSQHLVKAGETLYGIARKYGVDVMTLQALNSLQTEQLHLDQVIYLP